VTPLASLPEGYCAAVIGASGAIGAALVQALQADPRCARVHGLARSAVPSFDLNDEASIAAAVARLREAGPVHLVVCATGVLSLGPRSPEKRLADLDPATLAKAFAVNTTGPSLVLKHFHDLLPLKERGLLAVLSARVGSIGDNRKGGWYAYRASKAALNQLLHTAAIEVARKRPLAVLAALHPGTVQSALSAAIIGDAEATTPPAAAQNLLRVLDGLQPEQSGGFFAWDGTAIAW
jgi:NAD(P)-dependent dehydrogenase (short-subunit alcohol dehydrogenase family)